MGTSMVGEKGDSGEYKGGFELNPARRFTAARERTNLTEHSSGGVMIEDAEDEEEGELESCGGEG